MSDIRFGTKWVHADNGMIVAPYAIPMPEPQTNFVEIPGRDGALDLSEALGTVRYKFHSFFLKKAGITKKYIKKGNKLITVAAKYLGKSRLFIDRYLAIATFAVIRLFEEMNNNAIV